MPPRAACWTLPWPVVSRPSSILLGCFAGCAEPARPSIVTTCCVRRSPPDSDANVVSDILRLIGSGGSPVDQSEEIAGVKFECCVGAGSCVPSCFDRVQPEGRQSLGTPGSATALGTLAR